MSLRSSATVSRRNRLIRLADALLGILILTAVVAFFNPFAAIMIAIIPVVGLVWSLYSLRKSINGIDLPNAPRDEYQQHQVYDARTVGLRTAIFSIVGLMIVSSFLAVASRFTTLTVTEATGTLYPLFLAAIHAIPFSVTRSLAGAINRDELISAPE
ncbi:hypothetical protein [Corynebacterium tapiri]|uniref:Uncharacterized protein n=1 Tax=Corynebacterium tapiri TaxID=1448266 RepID=A0A5C4U657_9CORY|nr:hypothetical protein [Corynebacterium tapiri]TNM00376.1 hypothetical protein FHE74_00015 [Corynebacterium tapiri]